MLIRCYLAFLTAGLLLLGYLYWQSLGEVQMLSSYAKQQEKNERMLIEKIAVIDAQLAIKQQAYKGLKKAIEQKVLENKELVRQQEFYRLIFEPEYKKKGISLNDHELKRTGDRSASLSLTLVNFNKKHELLTGSIRLTVSGMQDGQISTFPINQILAEGSSFDERISFRFYYIIEEQLVFPVGFKPLKLHISVQLKNTTPSQWRQDVDLDWE